MIPTKVNKVYEIHPFEKAFIEFDQNPIANSDNSNEHRHQFCKMTITYHKHGVINIYIKYFLSVEQPNQ